MKNSIGSPVEFASLGSSFLMGLARNFWYSGVQRPQVLPLGIFVGNGSGGGMSVSREQMGLYGGPSPVYNDCSVCQEMEWISRITQANRYVPHDCKGENSEHCEYICQRQGLEDWTHLHQNFWFSSPCGTAYPAPRLAVFHQDRSYNSYWTLGGSHVTINKRRNWAQSCQVDVLNYRDWPTTDWSKYDLVLLHFRKGPKTARDMPLYKRPDLPLIIYGHDPWHGNPQEILTHYKPEVLLTPFPTMWQNIMHIPAHTGVRLYAISASNFFTRPNVDGPKPIDLLCIGALSKGPTGPYGPRIKLHEELMDTAKYPWLDDFVIEHRHKAQHGLAKPTEPLSEKNGFLNRYSEQLGRAKFVIFGGCNPPSDEQMLINYYEVLGCGAIPIIPYMKDLELLGVKALVHYIPCKDGMVGGVPPSAVPYLRSTLCGYDDLRYIARRAAAWHQREADRLLFGGFQDIVKELMGD